MGLVLRRVKFSALLILILSAAWSNAQEQDKATVPANATPPTSQSAEPAPATDEIDQRLVFLTVQLSTVESSIAATDKALKQKGYLKIAKEEAAEQARQKK